MANELIAAWRRTVRGHGARTALVDATTGASASFRALAARADAWTASQAAQDMAGRPVVFGTANGAAWFEVFLGIVQAGGIAVPLDPGEPPAEQRRLADALRAAFWWDGTKVVKLDAKPRRREPGVCAIKLTSGSTGRPRALRFTARQLTADARQVMASMGITARDTNYALIPLGHSYGLGNVSVPLIVAGVSAVIGSSALPHAVAADFSRFHPTVFPGVPAMWRALAESGIDATALRSLRLAISAGAPLPVETARTFAERFTIRIHGFYGSSETGGIAFDRTGDDSLRGGVGRPLRGVKLSVLPGGRLEVCSAAVFTLGNRRSRGSIGCWVMPDRVQIDPAGSLTLLGRRGATVKVAGRRVSLAEVLAHVRALPGVDDAWVGISDGNDAVLGAAVATSRPVAGLRSELRGRVAAWKVPRAWRAWDVLPLTARGKPDAAAIRAALFSPR